MKNKHLVALVVLGSFLLAAFPKQLGGQPGDSQSQAGAPLALPNESDVAARKAALVNDASDLDDLLKPLSGTEFNAAMAFDQEAGQGVAELDASLWFLVVYDHMQCGPDREIAKAVLKNRLAFYSHLLSLGTDQAAGNLAFARLPATAQAGARVKDDLRAAKGKLDEVAASLD